MSMEWLLRFVTWKSSVKGVLARRSEPLTATRKVRFRKEVKGVIFALNLLETWRGSVGLPVAVYLAPDPPGDGSFHPWNHFLGAYLPCHPAMRSRPSRYAVSFAQPWPRGLPWLRAPAKGGSGGWKDRGLCNCVVWRCIVGIVGIDLIRFEDRLTDVYEGYESICLLTAESKYVPSSHVTVLLTRFNDLLKLFCLTYGLWTSRIVSLKLIRGLIIPRIQNEASWLFPDMRASASV